MNARTIAARIGTCLAVGLALPLSGFAADNLPPETLNVKVFPDRYVAAGKPFATLAALEEWARPILLREVWVDSCGPAAAAQTLAAVERLQDTYNGAIRVRTFASTGCSGEHAGAVRPEDRAYLATDASGRSTLP